MFPRTVLSTLMNFWSQPPPPKKNILRNDAMTKSGVGSTVGNLFAVFVQLCRSCLALFVNKLLKPAVVIQPPSDGLNDSDVPEFDGGDGEEQPDETDKKRPIVEEGDSLHVGDCRDLHHVALHSCRHGPDAEQRFPGA